MNKTKKSHSEGCQDISHIVTLECPCALYLSKVRVICYKGKVHLTPPLRSHPIPFHWIRKAKLQLLCVWMKSVEECKESSVILQSSIYTQRGCGDGKKPLQSPFGSGQLLLGK